ncbi:hypothetical protein BCL79_1827 [Stenotrophomonas rhizophila]|uniref:Uncharacterized protein n=1 Tax=Stenotrophomonas rhizophila TaxID=216778 RepID=A0A498CJA9_9GAMM|nr:hypothetical protein [Stenotrophomonas rhizophila]RLK57421.1 hypothetical protein BCL79_1827 [Stenotrophomonas rhizophila]
MAFIKHSKKTKNLATAAIFAGVMMTGTGGSLYAGTDPHGYMVPGVERVEDHGSNSQVRREVVAPIRDQLEVITKGLQTTSANLARAMGVSRTTIYNWMKDNSAPGSAVQIKLDQLADAGRKLSEAGIPAKSSLALSIHSGKNFWEAFAAGSSADALIKNILASHQERASQRELIAARLAEKRSRGSLRRLDDVDLT